MCGEIGRILAQKERESDVERLEEQQQCHWEQLALNEDTQVHIQLSESCWMKRPSCSRNHCRVKRQQSIKPLWSEEVYGRLKYSGRRIRTWKQRLIQKLTGSNRVNMVRKLGNKCSNRLTNFESRQKWTSLSTRSGLKPCLTQPGRTAAQEGTHVGKSWRGKGRCQMNYI